MWGLNSKKKLNGKMEFPKDLFSLNEVKREKNRMQYPKAWKLHKTKENYVLCLVPRKLSKEYIGKTEGLK